MRIFAPRYYLDFKCLMGRCRHTCCAGWEMPVDEAAMKRYEGLDEPQREWIMSKIEGDATPHFCVDEKKRCAFLDRNGLCEMIERLGEDALCEVCREHPRYYNALSDRCETGLGLCCEEAARLVLFDGDDTFVEVGEDDEPAADCEDFEREMLEKRARVLSVIDGEGTLFERMRRLENEFGVPEKAQSVEAMLATYMGLERLERDYDGIIAAMPLDGELLSGYDGALTRLLRYFVYRHLTQAESEVDLAARLGFCLLSVRVVDALSRGKDRKGFIETARRYSAEIEYSEDNMQAILTELIW